MRGSLSAFLRIQRRGCAQPRDPVIFMVDSFADGTSFNNWVGKRGKYFFTRRVSLSRSREVLSCIDFGHELAGYTVAAASERQARAAALVTEECIRGMIV